MRPPEHGFGLRDARQALCREGINDHQKHQVDDAAFPKASPTARLGALATVTLLMPVASSGSDVTTASSASPIQLPDMPVRFAIASP